MGVRVDCRITALRLPAWMQLVNNTLAVKELPLNTFYLNIVISGQTSSGATATKLVVAQVNSNLISSNLTLNGGSATVIQQ